LSEKLFKGFLYKTPFITFAQHGTLKTLRELGFSTFDWLIDESYDEEINDRKRLKMVLGEIEKLLNTPISGIEEAIKERHYELDLNRERVKTFAQLQIDNIINLFDAE